MGCNYSVKKYTGYKKYFTIPYWRIQWARFVCGQPYLNILYTFKGKIND